MFNVGDMIVYGGEGVCRITDIQTRSFVGIDEKKMYYVLEQMENGGSKLFVPVDNDVLCKKMHQILSYEQVIELISNGFDELEWIDDSKQRPKYYKEILSSFDRKKIFALAKRLYEIKSGKYPSVKKLCTADEEILRKTSAIIMSELSLVANVTNDNVLPFICGEIVCERK